MTMVYSEVPDMSRITWRADPKNSKEFVISLSMRYFSLLQKIVTWSCLYVSRHSQSIISTSLSQAYVLYSVVSVPAYVVLRFFVILLIECSTLYLPKRMRHLE